jgi:hypothetical protein
MAEGIISRKGGSAFTTNALIRTASVSQGNTIVPGNIINLTQNNNTYTDQSELPSGTAIQTTEIFKLSDTRLLYFYGTSENFFSNVALVNVATDRLLSVITTIAVNDLSSARQATVVRLNDGRFLMLTIENGGNVSQLISYRFITVSGDTPSITSRLFYTTLTNSEHRGTSTGQSDSIRAEVINDNQVLLYYVNVNNQNTAVILTISGNTITVNTPFVLNTTFSTGRLDIKRIDETRYAVSYTNSSNNFPYIQVLVVSGPAPNYNTVTMGTAYIPVSRAWWSTSLIYYEHAGNNRLIISGYDQGAEFYLQYWYTVSGANLASFTNTSLVGLSSTTGRPSQSDNKNIHVEHLYADRFVATGEWTIDTNTNRYIFVYMYDATSAVITAQTNIFVGQGQVAKHFDIAYMNQNSFIISCSSFNTTASTVRGRFFYYHNVDHLVAANTSTLTAVRGFALTGGTQDQLIDVYTTGVSLT